MCINAAARTFTPGSSHPSHLEVHEVKHEAGFSLKAVVRGSEHGS